MLTMSSQRHAYRDGFATVQAETGFAAVIADTFIWCSILILSYVWVLLFTLRGLLFLNCELFITSLVV